MFSVTLLQSFTKLRSSTGVKIWQYCFADVTTRHFCGAGICYNNAKIRRSWAKKTDRYIAKMSPKIAFGFGESSKSQKRKKKWYMQAIQPVQMMVDGVTPQRRPVNEHNERRAKQLSVVLAQYINSLMNSGEICPELLDVGFEIIQVKMSSDFSVVNVYWLASSMEPEDMESLLEPAARKLRSAMVDLHIMGHMPHIHFVKDVSTARLQQVQDLLAIADFGDDYEPTDIAAGMRSDPEINYAKASTLQSKLARISDTFNVDDGFENIDVPGPGGSKEIIGRIPVQNSIIHDPEIADSTVDFKQNLYDVDHTRLVRQVLTARNKARDRSFQIPPGDKPSTFARSDVDRLLAQRRRQRHDVGRRESDAKLKLLSSVPQTSTASYEHDCDGETLDVEDYLDDRNL